MLKEAIHAISINVYKLPLSVILEPWAYLFSLFKLFQKTPADIA